MLNKKILAISGSSGTAIVAILLVATLGIPVEISTENKDEIPTQLGLGIPPGMELDVGTKIPQYITSNGVVTSVENTAWVKYKDTVIFNDYKYLQVFLDDKGYEDVILSMDLMQNNATAGDVLHSGSFIWITIAPYDSDPAEGFDASYYSTMDLNDDQTLIRINNQTSGPVSGMVQLVDFDGIKGTILPLDLWFMSDDFSYTIRGHITESEAIQLANIMLVIEQR